ncbi:MAG: penicillin-binding protein 2 [Clostridia bacterium]|nr:penicillin-binding protein 2 [Clostridia bacterium]
MKKRIKQEHVNLRFNVLIIIVYIIGIILVTRLFNLQIIHGGEYRETSNTRLSRESVLEATRGDILDRSGNILATTYTTFSLELYKTKSDDETLNKCILNIVNLLKKNNEEYPDNFPINENKKYTIKGEELEKWLKDYKLSQNATTDEAIQYFVDKYNITNDNWEDIRKIISIRYEITTKGYSSTKSIEIAKDVSRKVIAQISERNSEFPGITISTDTDRTYGYGNLGSHIIGYIGRITQNELDASKDYEYQKDDYVGKTGIEGLFEKYLRGVDGKEEIEMSVDGTVTGETVTVEAIQGSNIVLTIDAKLQSIAEKALKNNIQKIKKGGFGKKYNTEGGSVVVLDVNSGEVLAMASYPDYNPNSWVGGISQEDYKKIQKDNSLFNKSISGAYAPGSIFKMATAIAGLESGAINRSVKINDTGVYRRYSDYQPVCWYYTSYHRGHGYLNVSQAIEKSCNYFFYETANRMGIENLDKYAKYFGLGTKTGIELPSETAGILASPEAAKKAGETWSAGRTLQAAIGQSYNNFSPLQMAKYVSMVANGGKKINPTIIRNVLNADGTESSKSEIRKYAKDELGLEDDNSGDLKISKDNLNAVLAGMKSVTGDAGGTAYTIFKNFNIEVGGKTGSAEAGNKVNAWFAGFAPFNNPEICVVVMVENGGHGYYTGEVAKEIIAEYFGMNITNDEIKEDNKAESYVESLY